VANQTTALEFDLEAGPGLSARSKDKPAQAAAARSWDRANVIKKKINGSGFHARYPPSGIREIEKSIRKQYASSVSEFMQARSPVKILGFRAIQETRKRAKIGGLDITTKKGRYD
jgi:hypothetical protein